MQEISPRGSIAGRLGKSVGGALAEQVPKEVDRYRLKQGLQNFAKNSGNLSPSEQLAEVSSIPGATPQMIQSFGELAKQQSQAKALSGRSNANPDQFPRNNNDQQPPKGGNGKTPSITTQEPVQATIEGYIPKDYNQLLDRAGELYNENPALYKNDPNNAIAAATQEDTQNQAINNAQQAKRLSQQGVEERIRGQLERQTDKANVKVPEKVYSDIEDEAIDAVNSGKMTELQASKHYKKELDKISQEYESLRTIGKGKLFTRTPSENKAAIRSVRDQFKKRNDLKNFAQTLVAENGLSQSKANYLAYPLSDEKELNNEMSKIPKVNSSSRKLLRQDNIDQKTLELSKKLADKLGKNGSVLAVGEELKARKYNPNVWMDYVDKNKDKLKLTTDQVSELQHRSFTNSLDDLWMFTLSGLDNIVEQ